MSDLRAALANALGSLYHLEREVRPVDEYRMFVVTRVPGRAELLVKVLPAAVSLAINADRLEHELLLLADRLRHPNLVAPRGGGRAGSFIYHTRPFIEGTTLRNWMARKGPVPLLRAVDILRGVLGGLAHAHAGGIAHGDLRAEHVLLGVDGIHVADAGIAHLLGRTASPRDDMTALGTLVHEMLTSRPHSVHEEPLELGRALPSWLTEWMQTRWPDAGPALAALRPPPPPPPPSSPRASQPFA